MNELDILVIDLYILIRYYYIGNRQRINNFYVDMYNFVMKNLGVSIEYIELYNIRWNLVKN